MSVEKNARNETVSLFKQIRSPRGPSFSATVVHNSPRRPDNE